MAGGVLADFQHCHRTQLCMPMRKWHFWEKTRLDIAIFVAVDTHCNKNYFLCGNRPQIVAGVNAKQYCQK